MNDHDDEPPPHVKRLMEDLARTQQNRSERDYEVGHGKPPLHTRFKKGEPSRNPGGRPRKDKGFQQALEEALSRKVPVKMGGKTKWMTSNEVTIEQLLNAARLGKEWAVKMLFKTNQDLAPFKETGPSAAELEQKRALAAKLVDLLEAEASRTKPERPRPGKKDGDPEDGAALVPA